MQFRIIPLPIKANHSLRAALIALTAALRRTSAFLNRPIAKLSNFPRLLLRSTNRPIDLSTNLPGLPVPRSTNRPIDQSTNFPLLTSAFCLLLPLHAADPLKPNQPISPTPTPPSKTATANLTGLVEEKFKIGEIEIDGTAKSVRFPAEVNMTEGPLEYLLVTRWGKLHESLLKTAVSPTQLNAALLLLTPKPTNNFPLSPAQGGQIQDPRPLDLKGPEMEITVTWTDATKTNRFPASTLVKFQDPGEVKWIFNGSRLADGKFMAEESGSIISLITDVEALLNNRGPGMLNDDGWEPVKAQVPPVGTRVSLELKLRK